ncbi:MAG: hypothetical protein ACP5MU_03430 [Thermoplasmata archaeon]
MPNGNLRGMLLKDRIIDIVRGDGKSISEIYKEVNLDEDSKIHRLTLTGYLWAMADLGFLKERYQKPSKLYSLNKKEENSIYEIVASKLSDEPEDKKANEILYVLYKILDRPIFRVEMEKAGIIGDIKAKKIDKKERKKLIEKVELKGLRITPDTEAFIPTEEYPELAFRVIIDIIAEKFDIKKDKSGVQKKLENIL